MEVRLLAVQRDTVKEMLSHSSKSYGVHELARRTIAGSNIMLLEEASSGANNELLWN